MDDMRTVQGPDSADAQETTSLLATGPSEFARVLKPAIFLLMALKAGSNMFDNLMMSFDIATSPLNNSTDHFNGTMPVGISIAKLAAAFLLPTFGGALSDARLGPMNMLWVVVVMDLCGSAVLAILDWCNVIRFLPPTQLDPRVPFRNYAGFGDTLIFYSAMKLATDRRSRLLMISLYFIGSHSGELLGYVPGALRYFEKQSFGYLAVIVCVGSLICMILLSRSKPSALCTHRRGIRTAVARLHSFAPFRKFYVIAAVVIPYVASRSLCFLLFRQQLRNLTAATGDAELAASYAVSSGYQAGSVSVFVVLAIAAFRHRIPEWFTLRLRILTGVCLLVVMMVVLIVASLIDLHTSLIASALKGQPIVAWSIFVIISFVHGFGDGLTTLACYELIYCIADSSAKATFIGIFYISWVMSNILSFAVTALLKAHLGFGDSTQKPQFHCAYGIALCLLLLFIVYWEKISWPRASGLLIEFEEEERRSSSVAAGDSTESEFSLSLLNFEGNDF